MEIKDIVTIIGTIFSVAVSIKTLFFSSKKDSIKIDGNDNTAVINNIKQQSYVSSSTHISTNVSNKSNSTQDDTFLMLFQALVVIGALVVMLSFNTYVVSLLSIFTLVSLIVSINRARKVELSRQGITYIVVKHLMISILLASSMFIPVQIQEVTKQMKPFSFESFSMFSDWFTNSFGIVWGTLAGEAFFEKGILLIFRFFALAIIGISLLFNFRKKHFFNKIIKVIENLRKAYIGLIFFCLFLAISLHFQYVYFPFIVPFFTYIGNGVGNWFNK
ncbi:hypothetical protein [Vagococcus fluvialis]|uniref:Uncharacterized protein n=1 Tax=Vagococcus fluvialis TaxID=2738 RepID=A0A7X6D7N1_9ENTE|nr:hypothetical protein [Vagococcus fluvialis]NKC67351.1 hypothetical protein [Vagococcus fluvialis]